jgi:tetratricopeptide (TPR) repeat protein
MANIETLLSHYAAVVQKQEAERFRAQFPFFKAVVRAKSLDPLEAERLFTVQLNETEQGKKPKPAVPHFGLGILYKEMSEPEPAIEHLKKALETEPSFIPILTHLAEAYQMLGRDREAVRILERALTLNRNDKSVLYLLALSHENQGQHRRAIALFERLAAFAPVKKEVYYHLGLSYGRLNRLALAHYHFGIYFRESGKRDKAEFHFRKAEGLAGRDPVLKKRIQDARDEMG